MFEIDNDQSIYCGDLLAIRVNNEIFKLFDKNIKYKEKIKYACATNGQPLDDDFGSIYDEHILGYFVGRGFGISNPNLNLVRLRFSDSHGFYVTKQNYYKKMVILSIKHYLMFCRVWM